MTVLIALALVLGTGVLVLGVRWVRRLRDVRRIRAALAVPPSGDVFDPDDVADLPPPARRYLEHAIAPGTPIARAVWLHLTGRMKQRPDAEYMSLVADEVLTGAHGFLWQARLDAGLLRVHVTDHYLEDDAAVHVAAFGVVPMGADEGPDITRSSRGRLAAESVWLPSALLPAAGAQWTALDEARARVAFSIHGERFTLTLTVAPDGQLRELMMERYGNAGRDDDDFGPTPYGFTVRAERTFGGYTIPSELEGGWWYGTERYRPENASRFNVEAARFR